MAQAQLEDMYKYVMEHDEAKQAGKAYQPPAAPPTARSIGGKSDPATPTTPGFKKNKPAGLNLTREEKTQSRSSSLLSFLKSPRKTKAQGLEISAPIITPMTATFPGFPGQQGQEMAPISPRSYGPVAPPSQSDLPFRRAGANLPTPEMSPVSSGGIDERIDAALARPPTRDKKKAMRVETIRESRSEGRSEGRSEKGSSRTREASAESGSGSNSDADPPSATSSTSGLVGLPASPRPGVNRFPSLDSLPASPRPGSTFSRASKPTAVRAGGALPLRSYEPSLASPSLPRDGTKQTVFTRPAPGLMSPGLQTGLRTPWTGAPVPYTPYQPFSPVVPITPSLVTRADRKRYRKFEPKTPTVEMVRGEDDVW